jgi:hypothetical protein
MRRVNGKPFFRSNFDKKFNRTWNLAFINILISWGLLLTIIGFLIFGGIKLIDGVKEHGLKGVIERIWEGQGEKQRERQCSNSTGNTVYSVDNVH